MKCFIIDKLNVQRGNTHILKDVNLHIHNGELTALIGPNGAGKSTLFKALIGDIPYTGSFYYTDSPYKRLGKPKIGYVPQKLEFDYSFPVSVLDLFSASLSRFPVWLSHRGKMKSVATRSLEMVHAENLLDKRVGTLSGGELQRVLLALALNPIPDLLLLDEAFSAVDQSDLVLFYSLVKNLVEKYNIAAILVSHDLTLAAKYSGKMIFLNHSVRSVGTPEEVFAHETFITTFQRGIQNDCSAALKT
ncbi:MAG: Zinc import ATP-binding protein ZnuC [Candidatus Dichloromethanomonas elyunquensis]|nr:MAG: Zinc import ATP-binding protein ZnuC [Candidatus Dichloromethanomonas elyunquensis]